MSFVEFNGWVAAHRAIDRAEGRRAMLAQRAAFGADARDFDRLMDVLHGD